MVHNNGTVTIQKKKTTSQKKAIFKEYKPTIFLKTWIQKVSGMTQMQIQLNNCNDKTNMTSKMDGVYKHPKKNPIKVWLK